MARSDAVWAIDIGQCALKALKCRPHTDKSSIQAVAFDFIEYPKVLSQPDADPTALVADALRQFLSRNSVRGDRVYISVPGQNGLARFIKLPPVETKKIPDIVKYEAKQQIPFPLNEVVYRHQRMAGGSVVEGFAMETEVGLFAMKRDQAYRALRPFQEAGIEVDCIQLTPLALYNFVAFDQMVDLPPPEEYDIENPPESIVLLSLGTDTADLVVTNGFRVWQRSLPIGGNHFTKALTKELKLTYASAELQKRNALNAEDTKTLFQAMRPVFNDLLTEITRSINYFTNLDKKARVKRGLALGNAMKLPGLQRYLAQNLGFDLARVEAFRGLVGPAVVDAPVFKENVLSFGPCYGMAIQALRNSKVDINLVPDEIRNDRLIRAKKPWAVGAAAALLLGVTVNYASHYRAVASVRMEDLAGQKTDFGKVIPEVKSVIASANKNKMDFEKAGEKFKKTDIHGANLLVTVEGRRRWLEIIQAINACMPRDAEAASKTPEKRVQVIVTSVVCERADAVDRWYNESSTSIAEVAKSAVGEAATPKEGATPAAAQADIPKGAAWVFRVTGYHFHNTEGGEFGMAFVKSHFAANFLRDEISVVNDAGETLVVKVKKLGIEFPAIVDLGMNNDYEIEIDSDSIGAPADGEKLPDGVVLSDDGVLMRKLPRFDFAVEFVWRPPVAAEGAPAKAPDSAPPQKDETTPAVPKEPPAPATDQPAAVAPAPVVPAPVETTQPDPTAPVPAPDPAPSAP
jgi:type IV pilus assembly protein PilM